MTESLIKLPPDSTGKAVRAFANGVLDSGSPTYAQGFVVCDANGNIIASLATDPVGTEQALVVRNIPGAQVQNVAITGNAVATESTLQEATMALEQLADVLALAKDPVTGRLRIVQDGAAGTAQAVTVSSGTVTTVQNVGTGTGPVTTVPAQVPAWQAMQAPADALRSRITVGP